MSVVNSYSVLYEVSESLNNLLVRHTAAIKRIEMCNDTPEDTMKDTLSEVYRILCGLELSKESDRALRDYIASQIEGVESEPL